MYVDLRTYVTIWKRDHPLLKLNKRTEDIKGKAQSKVAVTKKEKAILTKRALKKKQKQNHHDLRVPKNKQKQNHQELQVSDEPARKTDKTGGGLDGHLV